MLGADLLAVHVRTMDWDSVRRKAYPYLRRRRFTSGELVCPDCGEEFQRIYEARNHDCRSEKRARRFRWMSEDR